MPKANSESRPALQLPQDRRFSYRFNRIAYALAQHMLLHIDREFGLNLAEYRILTVLADRKAPSIKDIAEYTQLDKAHVTRALTGLIGRGLATQIVDKQDRPRCQLRSHVRSGWNAA
jgi:DNA-binding MarR family transcriptional regulator